MPLNDPDTPDRNELLGNEHRNLVEEVADPTPTAEQNLQRFERGELVLKLSQSLPLCQRTALQSFYGWSFVKGGSLGSWCEGRTSESISVP